MLLPQNNLSATVAICTYNGARRLPDVLQALKSQKMPVNDWEIVVIDNCSTDNSRSVCEAIFAEFHGVSCRVISEKRPGLNFARCRAAEVAKGDVILFLDDDNIPFDNWVFEAIEAFKRRPKAGVIGGKVIPKWERKPTALAEEVANFALAICDYGDSEKLLKSKGGGVVGAGMCVRTELLRVIFGDQKIPSMVTDRVGNSLMSGGDLAISICARQLGWECWYIPTMEIHHKLPESRMSKEYLLRLYLGIGRGQAATRRLHDWKARTVLRYAIAGKDCVRWLSQRLTGPPSSLRKAHGDLASDLHELNLSLTLGRIKQVLGP